MISASPRSAVLQEGHGTARTWWPVTAGDMGCTSSAPSYVDSSTQHANATEDFEISDRKAEDSNISETEVIVNNNLSEQKDSESDPVLPPTHNGHREPILENMTQLLGNEAQVIDSKLDEHAVIEVLMSEKKEAEERRLRDEEILNELAKLSEELKEVDSNVIVYNGTRNISVDNTIAGNNKEDLTEIDLMESATDGDDVRSESSRTTRWEALADVGAELPPSLAIDHVTGQIYTFK